MLLFFRVAKCHTMLLIASASAAADDARLSRGYALLFHAVTPSTSRLFTTLHQYRFSRD